MSKRFITNHDLLMAYSNAFFKYLQEQSQIDFNLLMEKSNNDFEDICKEVLKDAEAIELLLYFYVRINNLQN